MSNSTQMNVNLRDDVYIDDALNHRANDHTDEDTANLANSIYATGGLLQAIGISATPDDMRTVTDRPYVLRFGFGRSKALFHLADMFEQPHWVEDVPATLREYDSEAKSKLDQVIENWRRKNISQVELGTTLLEILEGDKSLKQVDLANALGMSTSTLSNTLRVMDLPSEITDLVNEYDASKGEKGLSWSHARELAGLQSKGIKKETLIEEAIAGVGKTFGEFNADLKARFGGEAKNDEEGSTGNAATEGTQKSPTKSISSKQLAEKYLPKLTADFSKITDKVEKAVAQARIDTIKWVLKEGQTEIEKQLEPWEQELKAQAEAKEVADKQLSAMNKYIRAAASTINAKLKEIPSATLADGTPNPDRRMKTLPEVLEMVKNGVNESLAKAKAAGAADNVMEEGFPIASVEDFMQKISTHFAEEQKKRDDHRKQMEANKAAEAAKTAVAPAAEAAPAPVEEAAPAPAAKPGKAPAKKTVAKK